MQSVGEFFQCLLNRIRRTPPKGLSFIAYNEWIRRYDSMDDVMRLKLKDSSLSFPHKPLISIIMPNYNIELVWLRKAIHSVQAQIYCNWELCISDDCSTLAGTKEYIEELAQKDKRIKAFFRSENGHISANSNSALSLASGEFVALLDADDELSEDALYWVVKEINAHPSVDLIFSDEDKIDKLGRRSEPYFKSDWNLSLMCSQNAFSHLGVYRRKLVMQLGGFRIGYEGSQDLDLTLRCADASSQQRIRHIPRILYHWRILPQSAASSTANKPYAWGAGRRAILDHLERQRIGANIEPTMSNSYYRICYDKILDWPRVSIVIPSTLKSSVVEACLRSIFNKTTYNNLEIIIAVNKMTGKQISNSFLEDYKDDGRLKLLVYEKEPFNYSWTNNEAVRSSQGEYICFLHDDVEVITPDWVEQLVLRNRQTRVGAVGAMLYYPNETIQQAGVILGAGGVASHAFAHEPRNSTGYFGRAGLEQDYSCVTAACMIMSRKVFDEIGGFDEAFPVAFNDVDLCLRIRQNNYRIIWTPHVEMYHHESLTFGSHDSPERAVQFAQDFQEMRKRWDVQLDNDPFYSPNLNLKSPKKSPYTSFEWPPRIPTI